MYEKTADTPLSYDKAPVTGFASSTDVRHSVQNNKSQNDLSDASNSPPVSDVISPSEAHRVVMRIADDARRRTEREREIEAQLLAELMTDEFM